MDGGRTGSTLRNNTQDDLVIILAKEEYAVLPGELNASGPNVITRSTSNGIKDGHSLRSPSQPSNPLAAGWKGNSGTRLCNYGK